MTPALYLISSVLGNIRLFPIELKETFQGGNAEQ